MVTELGLQGAQQCTAGWAGKAGVGEAGKGAARVRQRVRGVGWSLFCRGEW